MRKTGGNVTSCFCTPEGRVISARGGPISGKELLRLAKSAVELYQKLDELESLEQQKTLVRNAHIKKIERQESAIELIHKSAGARLSRKDLTKFHAIRELAKSADPTKSLDDVLASQSLPHIKDVAPQIFVKLTGLPYQEDRELVRLAAQGFDLAKKNRRPMALIFSSNSESGVMKNGQLHLDPKVRELVDWVAWIALTKGSSKLPAPVVITVPIDQMAALSQLTNIPAYDLNGSARAHVSLAMVITDPDGQQLGGESVSKWQDDTQQSREQKLGTLGETLLKARKAAYEEAKKLRSQKKAERKLANR